jgi:glycosyltransferase involved in cell wall biosynthesis
MASGKPTIASAVGEVSQIIDDGKTGFIIPKSDMAALVNAMDRCIGMGDELAKVGAAARKMVAGFTIAKHLEAVQNEYDKILG